MPTVAIVGASPDPSRYAYQAVVMYRDLGWTVWPVHPKAQPVEGLPAFAHLGLLPARPDIICMYVNPDIGLGMLDTITAAAPARLWLNPGSEREDLILAAKQRGLVVVTACTLVVLARMDPMQARVV